MYKVNTKLDVNEFKLNAAGLLPVIAQDYESGEVLFLGQMNAEALEKTAETGYAHYVKPNGHVYKFGEVQGNTQEVKVAFSDGNGETMLLKVKQKGIANLEDKTFTMFSKQVIGAYNEIGGEMFGRLQRIVAEYRKNPVDGSYANFMFTRGLDKIAKKTGEEAVELVIAAKNTDKQEVIHESADFLYHMMLLLAVKGVSISEITAELCKRNR